MLTLAGEHDHLLTIFIEFDPGLPKTQSSLQPAQPAQWLYPHGPVVVDSLPLRITKRQARAAALFIKDV